MALPQLLESFKNMFPELNLDGTKMIDLWRAWELTEEFRQNIKVYDSIVISENETWDNLAEQVYGDRRLWWIIPMFNGIEDPFSLYFDKTVSGSINVIRVVKEDEINSILSDIRNKRLRLEVSNIKEEVS
jgi:hypothetical protein